MKQSRYKGVLATLAVAHWFANVSADTPGSMPVATWRDLGRHASMVPEIVVPDREPDGNSVIFYASSGLIVFDTGRHTWQRDAILALARAQKTRIVAIINSHWHLDHVSGNPYLHARYTALRA